jgi:hypothetical protein
VKKKFAYAASKLGAEHAPWCTFLSKKRKRRVARSCTICAHESHEEHPGAASILSVHNEIVLECATEDAEVADQWLSSTMRKAVEDVLGTRSSRVKTSWRPPWSIRGGRRRCSGPANSDTLFVLGRDAAAAS